VSAKVLRAWLRREFPRSAADHWQRWYLTHNQVSAVREHFAGSGRAAGHRVISTSVNTGGHRGDQAYVTDLVGGLLSEEPLREHRFPWLRGDRGHLLPVDGYFPRQRLVLEYRERQHLVDRPDSFGFWDRRMTASGVTRREQRARYDRLREAEIPRHGLTLVVVNADDLAVDRRGRLIRDRQADAPVLRRLLTAVGVLQSSEAPG
jgi:hypothetical protein